MEDSSILYQNAARTVFLIDIPASIALAQELRPSQKQDSFHHASLRTTRRKRRYLLSNPPPTVPYRSPPEPKTDAARARVLERIPVAERSFHADVIEPLVRNGLRELREGYEGAPWCLPRRTVEEDSEVPDASGCWTSASKERKRKPSKRENDEISAMSSAIMEKRQIEPGHACTYTTSRRCRSDEPPLILSPGKNDFESLAELQNLAVKNTSSEPAAIRVRSISGVIERAEKGASSHHSTTFNVAPKSAFILCTLPIERQPEELPSLNPIIPGLPVDKKFNLILLDPPWPNRSVRRSAQYHTHQYSDMATLTRYIGDILRMHLYDPNQEDRKEESNHNQSRESIAAIWVTNTEKSRIAAYEAIRAAGLSVCEEWVWIKTTVNGEPVMPVDGLWRKPYEILVIGRRRRPGDGLETSGGDSENGARTRRVIAAVPDVHSRKPNLKEVFKRIFFSSSSSSPLPVNGTTSATGSGANAEKEVHYEEQLVEYSALEVFARNLTAGWWACGNEVLKFNWDGWWVDE